MKQIDTSIRITDKLGNITEYDCIEKASEATGLSVQALKIRANKNSIPKDKICVEWINEHTKKSYKAKQSKSKGKDLEYRVRDKLREIGYIGCERSAGESKSKDNNKIDICDTENKLPINIQVKNYANTPNYFGIKSECTDKSKPFCLCWKKNTITTNNIVYFVPEDFFYELLDCYTKQHKIL